MIGTTGEFEIKSSISPGCCGNALLISAMFWGSSKPRHEKEVCVGFVSVLAQGARQR